ncbi:MAG: hypothetical protein RR845_26105, partial [Pseudomonas sp.]
VSGDVDGHTLLLGNDALMEQQQVDTSEVKSLLKQQAERGITPVLLSANGKPAALLSIRDPLRSDSVEALQRLHGLGYQLVML